MKPNTCRTCQHFMQHYRMNEDKIFRINCGHCVFPKMKQRNPTAKACEHFVPGPADTNAFASKTYLSKALLAYMMSLPLLPEIEDEP